MKVKTSITLSDDLIRALDEMIGKSGNKSAFVEAALRAYIAAKTRELREAQDLEILNRRAEALNEEAEDVLSYQAPL